MTSEPTGVAVTVSVKGCPAPGPPKDREHLLTRAVRQATEVDHPVHVVLFPGGFLRHDGFLCGLSFDERKHELNCASFAQALQDVASDLASKCQGARLVVGIDTAPKGEFGDQLCVAWGPAGVEAIGRKVFPVEGPEADNFPVDPRDFGERHRLLNLPLGRRALLCSCYDGFGIHDPDRFARLVKRIGANGEDSRSWRTGPLLKSAVRDWEALCKSADMALVAIHQFHARANSTMWQRHGIATASAGLNGGAVFAAAHFEKKLPSSGSQPLASRGVSRSHLVMGRGRKKESATPIRERSDGDLRLLWFDLS